MSKKIGPSRTVSKKNKAYWEAKERLEKAQSKYVQKPKKNSDDSMSSGEKKAAELRAKKRYNDRVWKGWRETDGVSYPVTVGKRKQKNER